MLYGWFQLLNLCMNLVLSIHSLLALFWPHVCEFCRCFLHCRLQDISSGYWVLVLHFTRREAVRQIDELQHIATNLGRSECCEGLWE